MMRWSVCLICCSVSGGVVFAQSSKAEAPAAQPASSSRAVTVRWASPASQAAVAKVKEIKSRLDRFQGLLAMSPEDRKKELSNKPELQRKYLRGELQKYDEMSLEERETALQGLHVWYYVR